MWVIESFTGCLQIIVDSMPEPIFGRRSFCNGVQGEFEFSAGPKCTFGSVGGATKQLNK